jgi:D-amino-acid dehydrogenase
MYDAIVVGGGIVGLSAAYQLVRAGARALLIDRADAGRATDAGAGILAPESNSRDPDAWVAFALRAVGAYPQLIAHLAADGAEDTGYAVCGQIVAAISEDEVEPFAAARRRVLERQQQRGQPSTDELHEIDADIGVKLFPALAPVRGAFFYRGAARVDGRLLASALRSASRARGLEMRQANVDRLVLNDRVVTGVQAGAEELRAGAVILASGAWSAAFAAQLGISIPVAPQRGQIIHLDLPDTDTAAWPIVNAFHGHYLVAWPGGRVVAGATRETGAGFVARTTAAGVHEVLGEALRVAPGLADASIREIRVGLRPATPDGLPVLGAVPGFRQVLLATGHGATGLQLGPYSGMLIADMALGSAADTDIGAFAVTRFRDGPAH